METARPGHSRWCAPASRRRTRVAASRWRRSWPAIDAGEFVMAASRLMTRVTLAGALLVAFAVPAAAQEPPFPQKGVLEITVLFPAGSSADWTPRLLAPGLGNHPQQPITLST